MKNINFIKRAVLDVIFALLLFTIYKKNVVSMMYHEVVGLIILGIIIVHLVFNRNWIINQLKNVFKKENTIQNKVLFINDLLLIITFVIIIVTGIFISKKLFHFEGYMWMKPWHFFFGMISLILLGIHFGLHDKFISLVFGSFKFFGKYKNAIICILLIGISIYGAYSLTNGDFVRYITIPWTAPQMGGNMMHGAGMGMQNGMGKGMGTGSFSLVKFASVAVSYMSIMTLFATITLFIKKLIEKNK